MADERDTRGVFETVWDNMTKTDSEVESKLRDMQETKEAYDLNNAGWG